jgi:hypothetical protein
VGCDKPQDFSLCFPVTVILLLAPGTIAAATSPQPEPVSPGGRQQSTLIAECCPTFSWGLAPGASRYEIAVFDALGSDSAEYAEQAAFGEPLLRAEIAAPALSWTPAGEDCLNEGGSYRWFLRAQTERASENGPTAVDSKWIWTPGISPRRCAEN